MYKKSKLVQSLIEILDLMPKDMPAEQVAEKEAIKKDLKKLEVRVKKLEEKENNIIKG